MVAEAAAQTKRTLGGDQALGVAVNINKLEDCERLVNTTRDVFGGLHILATSDDLEHATRQLRRALDIEGWG
jgi:hypothetical protein